MILPNILLVVLLIGLLITFHEFGHLIVAKLSRIPVEVFSIGFGPTLLKRRWRETEYRLSLIPLGGYIKMTGEDEPAATPTSGPRSAVSEVSGFNDKPLGIKAAVIAAGPVSNLLLGFLILLVMFGAFGIGFTPPVIDVVPGSAPAAQGLQTGDVVLAAGGETIPSFEEFEARLLQAAGRTVELRLMRDGGKLEVSFRVPVSYGSEELPPVVGRVLSGTRAESVGLQAGDTITAFNGQPVTTWASLVEAYQSSRDSALLIEWRRQGGVLAAVALPPSAESDTTLGIEVDLSWYLTPLVLPVVGRVRGGSPAARAGLRAGDTLASVAGEPISRWSQFVELVSARPGERFVVEWRHQGEPMSDSITAASQTDQVTGQRLGAVGVWVDLPRRRLSPLDVLRESALRTGYVVVKTFEIVYQVITRRISPKAIGGPIMVAKVAYEGTSWGAEYFLALWSLLSINLFVVNMLPIPVLDGGRILLFGIEAARRRRLSHRELGWAMNVGWILIGAVILLVLFNDILRLVRG